MNAFGVSLAQLDQVASVFRTEAEVALTVLRTFKAQIQILQDQYQAVPPDAWQMLMTDLDIYTSQYHDTVAGIGSGLHQNQVNYADIEAANARLVSVDEYTPIRDYDGGVHPDHQAITVSAQVSPGPAPENHAAAQPAPSHPADAAPTAAPAPTAAAAPAPAPTAAAAPAPAPADSAPSGAPSQVDAWIREATGILQASGVPASQLSPGDLWLIIQHESNGDPLAVNGWDSNAAAGTPSIGLMQTIQPTFDAYALPGHHEIRNPVDNIIAGTRYALDRYGSLGNVPGVQAVHNGQPYIGY